jgi:hypothetical protein
MGRGRGMPTIGDIARSKGFSGSKYHKYADMGINQQYAVDHSEGKKNSIYTSVDCYVSGTYTTNDGKTSEVKQRYTVYVSYNRETQKLAMNETRQRIIDDFSNNYPEFRVSDIFIPEASFITPLGNDGLVEDTQFYYGSELFKAMSRVDVAQYKIQTERDIYRNNVRNIKKRYGL